MLTSKLGELADWSSIRVFDLGIKLGWFHLNEPHGGEAIFNPARKVDTDYMAPEILDKTQSSTYPSDCYSLGVIVFELVFKRLPEIQEGKII